MSTKRPQTSSKKQTPVRRAPKERPATAQRRDEGGPKMQKVSIYLIRLANRIWPTFSFNLFRMIVLANAQPQPPRRQPRRPNR
jgi:hypothetical protein